jgi:hypothetical protein
MADQGKSDHWAELASVLGAEPVPVEEKKEEQVEGTETLMAGLGVEDPGEPAPPPRSFLPPVSAAPSPPPRRKVAPPNWDQLASDLGVAPTEVAHPVPPLPKPAVDKPPFEKPVFMSPLPEEEPTEMADVLSDAAEGLSEVAEELATVVEELADVVEAPATEKKGRRRRKRRRRSRDEEPARDAMPRDEEESVFPASAEEAAAMDEDLEREESGEVEPFVPFSEEPRPEGGSRRGRRRRRGRRERVESREGVPSDDEAEVEEGEVDQFEDAEFAEGDEGDEPLPAESFGSTGDFDEGDEDEDEDEDGDDQSPRVGFRNIPTWDEAVGLMIAKNMESRAKNPGGGRGPGGNRGRGNRGRRRPERK